jgi:hypothetical protein
MSYAAIEVELHEGRVVASSAEPLPQEGKGLLVILSDVRTENARAGWHDALSAIRSQQAARQHTPRTAEAVAAQLHQERTSWE